MTHYWRVLLLLMTCLMPLHWADAWQGGQKAADAGGSLDKVLSRMDQTAKEFKSAEANLAWEQYQKVINDTDVEEGKIYFRRVGNDIQMMADISKPAARQILYSNGRMQLFEPKVDRVTVYPAGKNRADVESFVVLGFGGGGHDLLKTFNVKYGGTENLNGVQTDTLELDPKSERLRGMFERLVMWIDPKLGIAIQQKFFQPEGDYRLTKYSDIRLNTKISDNAFKLKTDSKTTTVSPHG
ncbi:MAG: outer membrane lipoprotein carrier protein LolA [Acidobacteria bacterium]|nr:outer membrane lipoprotein carrier protein LolA [Acidobacteriota bacterium]